MDNMVSLKDLFGHILKKWPILVACLLVFAVALDVYGFRKAVASENASSEMHEAYVNAAPELPDYYTEEIYRLRNSLNDNEAAFCEAYAEVFRNFLADYEAGTLSEDSMRLEAYMEFLSSYKDILSVFSATQRAYYNSLVNINLNQGNGFGARVEAAEIAAESLVQPRWMLKGALAGIVFGCLVVGLPYVISYGKNKNETCA